jgi:hypothetical protein
MRKEKSKGDWNEINQQPEMVNSDDAADSCAGRSAAC